MIKKLRNGRPSKLTPEVAEKLVEQFKKGANTHTAAHAAEISPETLFKWMQRGRRGQGEVYTVFLHRVQKALADYETSLIGHMEKVGRGEAKGEWTALAWIAERRFRQRWAKVLPEERALEQTQRDLTRMTDEQLTEMFSRRMQGLAGVKRSVNGVNGNGKHHQQ